MPVRIAGSPKSTNNKRWKECGEKITLLHCWWVHTSTATMENSMEIP